VALADHVSAKQITVDQFKQTLADIELAENTDDDVRELARELDKLSDAALKTASSIGAIGVATAEMRRMASVDPLRFDTDRKSRSEIMADLAAGLRLQSSRLTGPKAKKTEAEKERERAAKAVERQKAAIRDYLSELEHENRLIGLTSLEQEKLNVLRRLGAHATDAQRQEALNWTEQNYRLRDSLQAAIDAEQLFATAAFDSILAVTDGTKSASDAMEDFARSIARAALQATLLGQGPLAGLFGTSNPAGGVGGILGAVFGGFRSFDGSGYTGMAPRVGGVDGKGGFPALLHPNETVIDHSKGRVAANQNSVVELRLSGDVEARILRKAGNQSVQITRQASPGIARQGADMAQERYGRQGGFESL